MLKHNLRDFVCQKEQLDGTEAEKIAVYCPPDPDVRAEACQHGFDPKKHLLLSGTEFRGRVYWFDPKTHLLLRYRCGCKWVAHDDRFDYPAPESVPRELFTFHVPRDAVLVVNDPALRREIQSEGQTEPDVPE
ncbi:MAG: hypothetical protein ACYTG0_46185 [Planctomycetota bacterium]|jgi:hypothetical protein